MQSHTERAIIVGASSGIGEALARALVAEGARVALVARRTARLESIIASISSPESDEARAYTCDVRDFTRSRELFGEIVSDLGGLDLIIYSSGVMPKDAHKTFPTDHDIAAIETNLTGAVIWLNEAARYFQQRRRGVIIGIGSVAGDRGRPRNPVYNATKAGLATYLESLRFRLARQGVTVVNIKPGLVRTEMTGDRFILPLPMEAGDAAIEILKAAREGKAVAYVPGWWRWVMLLVKILPRPLLEWFPF